MQLDFNPRIMKISGTVREYGSGIIDTALAANTANGASFIKYPFIVIEKDDGSYVKMKNVVTDAHVDNQLSNGNHATFYIRKWGSITYVFATESEGGVNTFVPPVSWTMRLVAMFFPAAIVGFIIGFFTTGIWFVGSLPGLAIFILSSWPLWPGLLFLFFMERMRGDAFELQQRLTTSSDHRGQYCGERIEVI